MLDVLLLLFHCLLELVRCQFKPSDPSFQLFIDFCLIFLHRASRLTAMRVQVSHPLVGLLIFIQLELHVFKQTVDFVQMDVQGVLDHGPGSHLIQKVLEAEERDEPWLFESVTLLCKFLGVLFFSHPTVGELSFALLVQIVVSSEIL